MRAHHSPSQPNIGASGYTLCRAKSHYRMSSFFCRLSILGIVTQYLGLLNKGISPFFLLLSELACKVKEGVRKAGGPSLSTRQVVHIVITHSHFYLPLPVPFHHIKLLSILHLDQHGSQHNRQQFVARVARTLPLSRVSTCQKSCASWSTNFCPM